jgi:hypothetical protein
VHALDLRQPTALAPDSRREAPAFTTVEVDIDLQTVICQVPSASCSRRCSRRLRRDGRRLALERAKRARHRLAHPAALAGRREGPFACSPDRDRVPMKRQEG